eukprot:gene12815-7457_t
MANAVTPSTHHFHDKLKVSKHQRKKWHQQVVSDTSTDPQKKDYEKMAAEEKAAAMEACKSSFSDNMAKESLHSRLPFPHAQGFQAPAQKVESTSGV